MKDSIDVRLNNFLDEYILDILNIYKKEFEETPNKNLKFDYNKEFDIGTYKYYANERRKLIDIYKASLINKNILNQKNIVAGVLNAAMMFKRGLQKRKARGAEMKKAEIGTKKNEEKKKLELKPEKVFQEDLDEEKGEKVKEVDEEKDEKVKEVDEKKDEKEKEVDDENKRL